VAETTVEQLAVDIAKRHGRPSSSYQGMGCLRRTSSHEGHKSHLFILPDPRARARKMPGTALTIMILVGVSRFIS
jgi:hypothetical protein